MARGSHREGSKPRSKGAGAKRKRGTPPGRAGAAPAPKLSAAESRLEQRAKVVDELVGALRSEGGRERAYAELYRQSTGGCLTRDEVSALTLAKHIVDRFAKKAIDQALPDKLADLEAQNAELKAALAGSKGSSLRAEAAVVPPLVNDEQRPDVAPAEGNPRGREPYQS